MCVCVHGWNMSNVTSGHSTSSFLQFSNVLRDMEARQLDGEYIGNLWGRCQVSKIVSGLVDVNFDDFFQHSTVVTTRGHPFKLFKCHSDVNVRKSFFSQRITNVWNSLSSDTVNFGTLRSFKRTIKLVDFSQFLKCF